ncbi:MAG: acyclic terpene utilization AtuA family protein [Pseudomonadota bacterium]|nr:acyclic terpene utilization AtuA family protein [Pseudomonadota bacterium]
MSIVRVANGQGFWGDSLQVPVDMVRRGGIDYLTLDYLAEVTMSILQKQRARDPAAGYARDFVDFVDAVLPALLDGNIRVVANAGGVNPAGCGAALQEVVRRHGLAGQVKIGVVTGDDILHRLEELSGAGVPFTNFDTGAPLSQVRDRITSANVYLGAGPIADALGQGAQIVVTGRCSDASLTVGPLVHEFGWALDDWDRIAAATVAGHIIECGAQCTGGNCLIDWDSIPDLDNIGYPVVEVAQDGTFIVTKQDGTGGRVDVAGVTEQLLYELGDPTAYITADCIADFTTVELAQAAPNRVRVSGIRGRATTPTYKVSMSYEAGYKAVGTLVYGWPQAYEKARAADQALRGRLQRMGLSYNKVLTEYVGANACHGELSGEPDPDIAEVQLRIGVRSGDRQAVSAFTKELAPLVCNGPPTVTGFAGGRPKVEQVVAYWPSLIPRELMTPELILLEG